MKMEKGGGDIYYPFGKKANTRHYPFKPEINPL